MFTPLDEERQEKAFLERIHGSDHRIPGVMTISSSSSKVVGAASSNGRVKTRLIMTATRHPLRACGSIYNFLKAIYDILEGLQLSQICVLLFIRLLPATSAPLPVQEETCASPRHQHPKYTLETLFLGRPT